MFLFYVHFFQRQCSGLKQIEKRFESKMSCFILSWTSALALPTMNYFGLIFQLGHQRETPLFTEFWFLLPYFPSHFLLLSHGLFVIPRGPRLETLGKAHAPHPLLRMPPLWGLQDLFLSKNSQTMLLSNLRFIDSSSPSLTLGDQNRCLFPLHR